MSRYFLVLHQFCQEKFLKDRIKVEGKAGALGEQITVSVEGTKLLVGVKGEFSKRYLKYLTKKFLKKDRVRDFIRVVSTDKETYVLRYFSVDNVDAGAEEDEE